MKKAISRAGESGAETPTDSPTAPPASGSPMPWRLDNRGYIVDKTGYVVIDTADLQFVEDARLIAAAPDLLAALMALEGRDFAIAGDDAIVEQMRAAVRKAVLP
jgi:hypothetical protein